MANPIELLKKPQYALLAGGAVIGGVYFVGKLRQNAATASATTSVARGTEDTTAVSDVPQFQNEQNQKFSQLQGQIDTYTAQLEQMRTEEKAQQEQYQAYVQQQAELSRSERADFLSRITEGNNQFASQFSTAIAQLTAQIKALQDKQSEATRSGGIGIGGPINVLPQQPRQPSQPSQPVTSTPGGYSTDCSGVRPRSLQYPYSYDLNGIKDLFNRIKRDGNHASDHIPMRETAMTAISGNHTQADIYAARDTYTSGIWAAGALNRIRRENGLKALDQNAMNALHADLVKWGNNVRNWDFNMIVELFQKYYAPYVCG